MDIQEAMQYCLEKSISIGMQNAQCVAQQCDVEELTAADGEISRLNLTITTTLHLTGIFDQKHAAISINSPGTASLDRAVDELSLLVRASKPDPAYAIADYQPPQEIERGAEAADRELMYARLAEFIEYCRATYPSSVPRETHLAFTRSHIYVRNSNNVNLAAHQGVYRFTSFFSAQNAATFSSAHLDRELQTFSAVERQIQQAVAQLAAAPLTEKFSGDVILSPESLGAFIALFADQLRDHAMISGASIFRHRLRETIASQKFTLHACPFAEEIIDSDLITPDGYVAQNSTIIGSGTLNSLLLSQRGARLLQQRRAMNNGDGYIIEAGGTPLDTMIASTRKGILIGALSLGKLSGNGDFYGVAPMCALVQNGEIRAPLRHVTIAGNLAEALQEIRFVSRERAEFGTAIFPWLQIRNIMIAGE